jgi:tetratricopeptide (TPR) repeat protein
VVWLKFYGYYLSSCILGIHWSYYQPYMADFITTSLGRKEATRIDRYFLIGVLALWLIFCNLNHLTAQPYGLIWGLTWFTINIAMWCNLITFQQHISMRYVYVANVGLMLGISNTLLTYAPWLIPAIASWYYAGLLQIMPFYKSDYWASEYLIIHEPNYAYSWLLHGNMNFVRSHFGAAILDYKEALNIRDHDFKSYFNLSSAYIAVRRPDLAKEQLEICRNLEVFGQEEEKEILIKARERLLARIDEATRTRKPLILNIPDIPIVT